LSNIIIIIIYISFQKKISSGVTEGLCDNSRGFGYESTQTSSEEIEKEREEK
jgi:hypothetical protein